MTAGPSGDGVRTVFLGSGRFGAPALRRLAAHPDLDLVGVVTAPPRPAGRRGELTATPIGALAADLGIPAILTPARLRAPEAIAEVLALRPALAVLADYGQLVPQPLLDLPHGALNLHPSALPRWRGASPIPAAILAGDPMTAVTLMRMDAGMDTGPIVAMERVPVGSDEAASALEDRLAETAAALLDRSVGPWLRGELPSVPQPEQGTTLTRLLRREDGRLDPRRPAADLERAVRALAPWPGTFLEVGGERLVVEQVAVSPGEPRDEPGRIVALDGQPALATADGRLVLVRVRPAGRHAMSGAEYLRGHRDILGRRVEVPGPAVPESSR
jgi:methionyl-tRNA formyltransferase